jgi:hypothetical protein
VDGWWQGVYSVLLTLFTLVTQTMASRRREIINQPLPSTRLLPSGDKGEEVEQTKRWPIVQPLLQWKLGEKWYSRTKRELVHFVWTD